MCCWRSKSLDEIQIRLEGINLALKVAVVLAAAASYWTLASSGQTGVWISRVDLPDYVKAVINSSPSPCMIFSAEGFKKEAFSYDLWNFEAKVTLAELRLTGSEIEDNCGLSYDFESSDKEFSEEMHVDALLDDCGVSGYWRLMIFAFLFVLVFQATGFFSKAFETKWGKEKLKVSKVKFWNSWVLTWLEPKVIGFVQGFTTIVLPYLLLYPLTSATSIDGKVYIKLPGDFSNMILGSLLVMPLATATIRVYEVAKRGTALRQCVDYLSDEKNIYVLFFVACIACCPLAGAGALAGCALYVFVVDGFPLSFTFLFSINFSIALEFSIDVLQIFFSMLMLVDIIGILLKIIKGCRKCTGNAGNEIEAESKEEEIQEPKEADDAEAAAEQSAKTRPEAAPMPPVVAPVAVANPMVPTLPPVVAPVAMTLPPVVAPVAMANPAAPTMPPVVAPSVPKAPVLQTKRTVEAI